MLNRGLVAALAAVVLAGMSVDTAVSARRYARGAHGYDVSYPNCSQRLDARAAFAVIGLNGGRPFTFNPCFRREYTRYSHTGAVDLYLNTGYDSWFPQVVAADCAHAAQGRRNRIAYAVGCSEAESSIAHLRSMGLPPPRIWWLDVETSNGWSSSRAFNTSVLRGMLDRLRVETPHSIIGVYSLSSWWHRITQGWNPSLPEWIPRTRGVSCTTPFAAGPVWISQTGSHAIDVDIAC